MRQRHPSRHDAHAAAPNIPRCWMMVDARLGDRRAILRAIAHMPPCSGVIVRPYALPVAGRPALIRAIRRVARAKRHCILMADGASAAGFDGRHGPARPPRQTGMLRSMAVHDRREARQAGRDRVDIAFISPLWATRSHADALTLGRAGFARLAATIGAKAIALGGMDAKRYRPLRHQGAHGWAAIDAWIVD